MQIKLDLLTCLYKFKILIPTWEEKTIKYVVKKLKPGLNNKKRLVRKMCGMCITAWSMNE